MEHFSVEWVARKHDSLLDRCQAADLNSVKLTADGELIVSLPNWVLEMMEEFAADQHSWIKITDDPQTLPPEGIEVWIAIEVLNGSWLYRPVKRRGEWLEFKVGSDNYVWSLKQAKFWRTLAPPPES